MGDALRSADPKPDVVLVHGTTDDGNGLKVLRARDGQVEAGEVRALTAGQPIHGEVVRLKPRDAGSPLCDVETILPAPQAARATSASPASGSQQQATSNPQQAAHKGPARVTSDAYRSNWDRLFARVESSDQPAPSDRKLLN